MRKIWLIPDRDFAPLYTGECKTLLNILEPESLDITHTIYMSEMEGRWGATRQQARCFLYLKRQCGCLTTYSSHLIRPLNYLTYCIAFSHSHFRVVGVWLRHCSSGLYIVKVFFLGKQRRLERDITPILDLTGVIAVS